MAKVEVPCNFIGLFKVGDNLRYNCRILCQLVDTNTDGLFNKMIVLQAGAIIEAALTQIIYRAQNFHREGVPSIAESDRKKIEDSKVDKFAVAIDVLRKHRVLDGIGGGVYDDLHRLRRYRNKIHIQEDVKLDLPSRNEHTIFNGELSAWALEMNRRVLSYLSTDLARPEHIHDYVGALVVPT